MTIVAWFWMIGSVFTALLAFVTLDQLGASWRVFVFLCAIPSSSAALAIFCFVPESPRYFALKGRFSEALSTALLIARKSGYQGSPLTIEEVEYQYNWVTHDDRTRSDSISSPRRSVGSSRTTLRKVSVDESDISKSCGSQLYQGWILSRDTVLSIYAGRTRRKVIMLQVVWFCLSFGSYGLVTWIVSLFKEIGVLNKNGDPYLNALIFAGASRPETLFLPC